jgi:hypothetical protein
MSNKRASCLLRFCLLACLVAGMSSLTACDSGGSGIPPSDLEGTYVFEQFEFTVRGVDDFNVLQDTLIASERSPRLEFFGGNARVNLVYRLEGSTASSLISGSFSTRRDRVTIDISEVASDTRFELLLPTVLQLQLVNDRDTLRANQTVEEVELSRYAPGRYGGLTQPVNGTLQLRLVRVESGETSSSVP